MLQTEHQSVKPKIIIIFKRYINESHEIKEVFLDVKNGI